MSGELIIPGTPVGPFETIPVDPVYAHSLRIAPGDGSPAVGFNVDYYNPVGGTGHMFCVEAGSRSSTRVGKNHLETWRVIARGTGSVLRTSVVRLQQLVARSQYGYQSGGDVPLWLVEQLPQESARQALIYTLDVTPLDDAVAQRNQRFGAQLYAITVERGPWETAERLWHTYQTLGLTDTNSSYSVPAKFEQGDRPGRIVQAIVDTQATNAQSNRRMQYVWLGIKPDLVGGLDDFNPRIRIGKTNSARNSLIYTDTDFTAEDATTYFGSYGVQCTFASEEGWTQRVSTRLAYWNDTTAGLSWWEYRQYLGDYRLVARVRSTDADSVTATRFGLQASTSLGTNTAKTYGQRFYPASVPNTFKYMDLGDITIGGPAWGNEISTYQNLEWFTVYIEAARFSGSGQLVMDDCWLIPKEHFIRVELPAELDAADMLSIYTTPRDTVMAYARGRSNWRSNVLAQAGTPGQPLDVPTDIKQIATIVEQNNWSMPSTGGRVVLLTDSRDGTTRPLTAKNLLSFTVAPRTEVYFD
jgi:hypothetical protein